MALVALLITGAALVTPPIAVASSVTLSRREVPPEATVVPLRASVERITKRKNTSLWLFKSATDPRSKATVLALLLKPLDQLTTTPLVLGKS